MAHPKQQSCPECAEGVAPIGVDRREFMRTVSGVVGVVGGMAMLPPSLRAEEKATAKPAEDLVRELYTSLSEDQKKEMVLPWDHGGSDPSRLKTHNRPPLGKRLGEQFSKAQQELIQKTFKAILSGDDAYERLTRHGKWDGAGSFEGNGVAIYGDPSGDKPFSWVFAGHHLTLRCDGNSEPKAAFGGPMYYGHSANGHSAMNVYNYQTKKVMAVFDMLTPKHQEAATIVGSPGDGAAGLRFRPEDQRPGVLFADLNKEEQTLVTDVMRTLIDPFRKEDGDEVMELIKANGGMEKVRLAFFKEDAEKGNDRWDFWRLEGPGFVWNYRVLPHVHCFVNVVGQA